MGKAAKTMVAGDTTFVQDGTYVEGAIEFLTDGTASNPITLEAQNSRQAVLQSTSGCSPNISISANYIRVAGLRLTLDATSNVSNCSPPHPNSASGTGIRFWPGNSPRLAGNPNTINYGSLVRDVEISGGSSPHARSHGVKMACDNCILEDSLIHSGVESMGAQNMIMRRNTIDGCDAWGSCFIHKGGARNVQVYDNTLIIPPLKFPMGLVLGASSCLNCIFDPTAGVECYNCVAYNNAVIDNGSPSNLTLGMWGCKNCAIYNNVVNKGQLVSFASNHGYRPENPKFINNIVKCNGKSAISGAQYINPTFNYNNFFNCTGVPSQTNPITGDPLIINYTVSPYNWHLQTGSPAIGNGTPTSFTGYNGEAISVNRDKNKVLRTLPWDLGIYSYANGSGGGATPMPPQNLVVE
jgi:hypothetical protein